MRHNGDWVVAGFVGMIEFVGEGPTFTDAMIKLGSWIDAA